MSSPSTDNLRGHRAKYEALTASHPPDVAANEFVGGGDPIHTGYVELELVRRFKAIEGAAIVDIGCGIGRLTRHLRHEPIASYLGIDIIPEIMQAAVDGAEGDERFRFAIGEQCRIAQGDATADVVAAFSVITHLLDEECFEYFLEARRVLRPGGVALFSFLDFESPIHRPMFFAHARQQRLGHGDLLKFTTFGVLREFAVEAGFSRVDHVPGGEAIKTSGRTSPVMAPEKIPQTVALGQSLCVMTVPLAP